MATALTQAEARQHKLQAARGNMRSLDIILEHLLGGDITLDNLEVALATFDAIIGGDSSLGITGEVGTENQEQDILVHIAPTSGSTIIRGNNWLSSRAEFDPAYGLDVGVKPITLNESVFETAINDPIGGQFLANLQDLVARGIIEVADDGTPLTPEQIRDFAAT